jgi:hypothetical protein
VVIKLRIDANQGVYVYTAIGLVSVG